MHLKVGIGKEAKLTDLQTFILTLYPPTYIMLADVNVLCEQLPYKTKNVIVTGMLLQRIGAHRVYRKIIAPWKALLISGVPRGGVSGVQTPPPRNSEGPPKNRAKLNPTVKTVLKNAEFRTPTHQDVPKKKAVKF